MILSGVQTAMSYGWINGTDKGTFQPDRSITQVEAATIINRVMALLAEYLNIGTNDTSMSPSGLASRAQIAAIMMRFCERYVKP